MGRYWHYTEMVVNIYGSMKVKIDNAMSQVGIPLAKSWNSFFGQEEYETQEPVLRITCLVVIDLHRGKVGHFI